MYPLCTSIAFYEPKNLHFLYSRMDQPILKCIKEYIFNTLKMIDGDRPTVDIAW